MLTPRLAEIRQRLISKGSERTVSEDELLDELDELHRRLDRGFVEEIRKEIAIFSGPAENCSCCGSRL